MALRTWAKMLLLAVGAAAVVATSQLGVAYGLGIARLTRTFDGVTRDQWPAQLAWFAWFAVVSAAAGAWIAGRITREVRRTPAVNVALSVAGALGAAVVTPLAMGPASTADVTGTDPVIVIGMSAGLGALAGAAAGYAALSSRAARLSMAATTSAMWLLALLSTLPSLRGADSPPAVRLGGLDPGSFAATTTQRFALFTMPALALIFGALLGWFARRRASPQATVAAAGLAGPALLSVAYLIAGPGTGDQRYQSVPYWAALGATFAGVLGSVLAAVVRRTGDQEAEDLEGTAPDGQPLAGTGGFGTADGPPPSLSGNAPPTSHGAPVPPPPAPDSPAAFAAPPIDGPSHTFDDGPVGNLVPRPREATAPGRTRDGRVQHNDVNYADWFTELGANGR